MRALVKHRRLQVRLSSQEASDLIRAARQESNRRGEIVAAGTLLRECAMPLIRELIAPQTETEADRRQGERRKPAA